MCMCMCAGRVGGGTSGVVMKPTLMMMMVVGVTVRQDVRLAVCPATSKESHAPEGPQVLIHAPLGSAVRYSIMRF